MATAPPDLRDHPRDPWAGVRRPWYERLFRLFFSPRVRPASALGGEDAPYPEEHYVVRDLLELRSPSSGDAFEFIVRLRCGWRLKSLTNEPAAVSRDRLESLIAYRQRRLELELEDTIRAITREHTVAECAAVEQAINDRLTNGWTFDEGSFILHFTVRSRVGMDPEIRDTFRHAWLIDTVSAGEQHTTRNEINRIGERAQLWQELLDRLEERASHDAILLAVRPQDRETVLARQSGNGLQPGLEQEIQNSGLEQAAFELKQAARELLKIVGAGPTEAADDDQDLQDDQNGSDTGRAGETE